MDLRRLFRRAHEIARAIAGPGLSYAANLTLALRKLWSDLRRPLPALSGCGRKAMERAARTRADFHDWLVQDLEDAVLAYKDEPGIFDQGAKLLRALHETTDTGFWLEVGKSGLFALEWVAEYLKAKEVS